MWPFIAKETPKISIPEARARLAGMMAQRALLTQICNAPHTSTDRENLVRVAGECAELEQKIANAQQADERQDANAHLVDLVEGLIEDRCRHEDRLRKIEDPLRRAGWLKE